MALLTKDEVKHLLNLTDSTYDVQIETLIPYVQEDLCTYLDTYFQDGYIYRESGSAIVINRGSTSTASAADTITDSDSLFIQKGFASGMDIAIEGGYTNVGIHHVKTAVAGTLTLSSTGVLISQNPNSTLDNNYIGTLKVSYVNWPKALKRYGAQMVWFNISRQKATGVQSERIDDYSVTYAPLANGGYPPEVLAGLKKWRRAALR